MSGTLSIRLQDVVESLPTSYGEESEADGRASAPVVKVSNVGPSGEMKVPFENRYFAVRSLDELLCREGDLLVVKSSGSKANVLSGKTAFVDGRTAGCVASNFLMKLRPHPRKVVSRYLWWYLNSPNSKAFVLKVVGTTTYPNLKWSTYGKQPIPLPPLSEQRRIAAILDKADALRAKRREAIAKLDQLLQSVFLELFGHPATNPMGWPLAHLDEVCRPKQWPTISGADLTEAGYPVYGANGKIGFYSRYNHQHPTVLITCRGATCGTINVCEPESYVTGNAMALDDLDDSKTSIHFLEHFLKIRGLGDAITGAAQPQITRQNLKVVDVFVPPQSSRHRFTVVAEHIGKQKRFLSNAIEHLDALLASLQRRAFTGIL